MTNPTIGGSTPAEALERLGDMTGGFDPLPAETFAARLATMQQQLKQAGASALYLHASTNLFYFTGLAWHPSERMVAAVIPAEGELFYIAPRFEIDTLRDYWQLPAEIHTWEEHECPYRLLKQQLANINGGERVLWIDETTPYFTVSGIQHALEGWQTCSAQRWIQNQRSLKSPEEIRLIRQAHQMTMAVQQGAASILRPGISTTEVERWINEAHREVGAAGSTFCIVLFGKATSFPHGVKDPQQLNEQDWVLVDTGCLLHGYHSDITRTYAFGTPTPAQASAWETEKSAQLAAFDAAQVGVACEVSDTAARKVLETAGYGPDYQLPGLPHRTGHGCGLDIHEAPNLVRGETTPMAPGMVFSNEPMLVIPGQFGVRLEDHFYLDESGPQWLTKPAHSLEQPFLQQ